MWTFLMIWKQKMLGYYSRASLTVIFFSWGTNKKREWARSRILSIKEETLGWERPGQILLSGECLLVAWKMLDCACLPESAFLFTHAQPLMSLDKGAKLCSLCICIYICNCICNFPSWISKSQLTSALFSQERGKLDGLLASSDKLEGFLTSVDKKRANKKMSPPSKEMRSNYLFSVKHRAEFADEVNERVPFLNGGANTGRFKMEKCQTEYRRCEYEQLN